LARAAPFRTLGRSARQNSKSFVQFRMIRKYALLAKLTLSPHDLQAETEKITWR
jgi:hypothetical protein